MADGAVVLVTLAMALVGLRRGLVCLAFAAAGVVGGGLAGVALAPILLPGDESPWSPAFALVGALSGAAVAGTVGAALARRLGSYLEAGPLRALDALGGLVLGACVGLALAWVAGALVLHAPGQTAFRESVRSSTILGRLNQLVRPERLIAALERFEPLPLLPGPPPPEESVDPEVLERPGVREAAPSVVRVVGSACGLSMAGSGWVAEPGLVVTNAHVVAGQRDTRVQVPGRRGSIPVEVVAFDVRNDVAILRSESIESEPLALTDSPTRGETVAIIGYPGGASLQVTPGRVGRTVTVLAPNARGEGRVERRVTALRGEVRRGNSGGPAVNADGEVETMIFGGRVGDPSGALGVPPAAIREALASVDGPVSTGPCAPLDDPFQTA